MSRCSSGSSTYPPSPITGFEDPGLSRARLNGDGSATLCNDPLAPVCEHIGALLVVDVCRDGNDASGRTQFAEFIWRHPTTGRW
jgi:hypothetical protein